MYFFRVSFFQLDNQKPTIELSDGWYTIPCFLDLELFKLVNNKSIFVGLKLAICNAILVGPVEGISPLENTVVSLSMHYFQLIYIFIFSHFNGVRRAKWYSKLGFQKTRFFDIPLRTIKPRGGSIPCSTFAVLHSFPILYREKSNPGIIIFYISIHIESKVLIRNNQSEFMFEDSVRNSGENFLLNNEDQNNLLIRTERKSSPFYKVLVCSWPIFCPPNDFDTNQIVVHFYLIIILIPSLMLVVIY